DTFGDVACLSGANTEIAKTTAAKNPSPTSSVINELASKSVPACSILQSSLPDYCKQSSCTISKTLSSSIDNIDKMSNESEEEKKEMIVEKSSPNAQSLLDEVMQAFSEIYVDDKKIHSTTNEEAVLSKVTDMSNNIVVTNGLPPRPPAKPFRTDQQQEQTTFNFKLGHISSAESMHITDHVVSEEAKNAYDLLINGYRSVSPTSLTHSCHPDSSTPLLLRSRCTSSDSEHHQQQGITPDIPHETHHHHPAAILFGSSSSSSSISLSTTSSSRLQNDSKNVSSISNSSSSSANVASTRSYNYNDRNSHYSATSTDNDISIDLQNGEHHISPQHKSTNHPLFIATGGGSIKTQLAVSTETRDNCSASPLRLFRSGVAPSLLPKPIRQQQQQQQSSSLLQAPTSDGSQLHTPSSSNSNTLDNSYNHNDSNLILVEDNVSLSNSSTNAHSLPSSQKNHPTTTTISIVDSTGQQLPPPPDLSSLGSKLTTATTLRTLKLPLSIVQTTPMNHYRTKKRFNLFAS
ncbi:unnamed protein product, partial [Didymodactylos carnosus]